MQLGPQGITSATNPSPYDGTLFSKNPLSRGALGRSTTPEWGELLPRRTLEAAVAGRPGPADRVPYDYVYEVQHRALAEAHAGFRRRGGARRLVPRARSSGASTAFRRANADWLERDAFYERAQGRNGGAPLDQSGCPPRASRCSTSGCGTRRRNEEGAAAVRRAQLRETHAVELEAFAFTQYLLHEQHRLPAGAPRAALAEALRGPADRSLAPGTPGSPAASCCRTT